MSVTAYCWMLLLLLLGVATAEQLTDQELSVEDSDEERSLFTSEGSYYIALNTTYLILGTLFIGAAVLAAYLLSSLGESEPPVVGFEEPLYSRGDFEGHKGHPHRHRGRRNAFDANLNNQVALLSQAFQKYEVTEAGCKLYVACESSRVNTVEKRGKLAKLVSQILSNIDESGKEEMFEDNVYMKDMMAAFKIGSIGSDCSTFRKECRKLKVF